MIAALVRLGAPSFARMLLTCRRTVPMLSTRSLGDVVVAHAGREQGEDLALAGRQVSADLVLPVGHHGLHDAGVDGPSPVTRIADGLHQRLGARVLEQKADRAGLQRLLHELAVGVARQGDHLDRWERLLDAGRGVGAVHHRHDDVHEHDVRLGERHELHGLRAVGRLAHHVEVEGGGEQELEALADHEVVVDDHDSSASWIAHAPPLPGSVTGAKTAPHGGDGRPAAGRAVDLERRAHLVEAFAHDAQPHALGPDRARVEPHAVVADAQADHAVVSRRTLHRPAVARACLAMLLKASWVTR